MKMTIAEYQRKMPDGSCHTLIPKGTPVEIEEVTKNLYEVTANKPVTKNGDNSIMVSRDELDYFIQGVK